VLPRELAQYTAGWRPIGKAVSDPQRLQHFERIGLHDEFVLGVNFFATAGT
jgi:hypothetical protein